MEECAHEGTNDSRYVGLDVVGSGGVLRVFRYVDPRPIMDISTSSAKDLAERSAAYSPGRRDNRQGTYPNLDPSPISDRVVVERGVAGMAQIPRRGRLFSRPVRHSASRSQGDQHASRTPKGIELPVRLTTLPKTKTPSSNAAAGHSSTTGRSEGDTGIAIRVR